MNPYSPQHVRKFTAAHCHTYTVMRRFGHLLMHAASLLRTTSTITTDRPTAPPSSNGTDGTRDLAVVATKYQSLTHPSRTTKAQKDFSDLPVSVTSSGTRVLAVVATKYQHPHTRTRY